LNGVSPPRLGAHLEFENTCRPLGTSDLPASFYQSKNTIGEGLSEVTWKTVVAQESPLFPSRLGNLKTCLMVRGGWGRETCRGQHRSGEEQEGPTDRSAKRTSPASFPHRLTGQVLEEPRWALSSGVSSFSQACVVLGTALRVPQRQRESPGPLVRGILKGLLLGRPPASAWCSLQGSA
jgi:hypothetical protein